jgi:hypothetical protein
LLPSLPGKDAERREPRLDDVTGGVRAEADPAVAETAAPASGAPSAGLAGDDLPKLQAVLHELTECRRLLDDVLR